MQFIIPQFIDIEDTIIGPITLKQFLFLVCVGALLFLFWYLFKLWFVVLVGGPIALLALALVLIKVNGRPLPGFLKSWASYWLKPRFYIWGKK